MSRAAKLTLLGSSVFALSTIVFVHYAQQSEKAVSPSRFFYLLTNASHASEEGSG
jgi:hypothetical protein